MSFSPPTGLKHIPPGGGDVSQDRPGGPLYPAIKNSPRKSSRNYGAFLILILFGCIPGYHVDALPKCGKFFFAIADFAVCT